MPHETKTAPTGRVRSAAVLGAGTMGAQIAAHLANAGVSVLLLDVTPEVAREGLARAKRLKPHPLFSSDTARLITTGGLDSDLAKLAQADWIIEAIIEQLDAKRALLERIEPVRAETAAVTSNTSGIPISAIAQGRSEIFRRHWFGTHFFNPPRYLHLLEVIPTPDTDPAVVAAISHFADHQLGKGIVVAKDTPNFIANHIGLYGLVQAVRAVESGEYTVEEIDAITGPALGRPKSATFRTLDIAGIDVVDHVLRNLEERLPSEAARDAFRLPPLIQGLVERKAFGEKTGQGFYKRQKTASGESEILTLDPATLTYRPRQSARIASIETSRAIADTSERTKALFFAHDKAGQFLRRTLTPLLIYTARVALDIAYSIDDVDRAMKWGFGWELGPFEMWDAIGVREVIETAQAERVIADSEIPALAAAVLQAGRNRFRDDGVPPAAADLQLLKSARERSRIVRQNQGASLVDLGDGVLAVELHSKLNAIGGDTLEMLHAGVREASTNFQALVVCTQAQTFSAGANLILLLLEAQEGNWDEIDLMIRAFQGATEALRYADVPVVVAALGLTLGGGCEIALHGDRVQAAGDLFMGLVEAGVGLIPAGGGTKEMAARAAAARPDARADLLPFVQRAFETIGFAKVSASATDARALGLLREHDRVTMNAERLIADAKAAALERVHDGYQRPVPTEIAVGGETVLAALKLGVHLAWRAGRISDHDALIGRTLAFILSGGALPHQTSVSEQYLLDLEREAFLKLCGERKTLERIQHTLKTGKTLRN